MKVYDKLVRDKVPDVIREEGEIPYTHQATGSELEKALWAKLEEEITEFNETKNPQELADVLEVVYAIAKFYGLKPKELERLRHEKAEQKGMFSEGIILEKTEYE